MRYPVAGGSIAVQLTSGGMRVGAAAPIRNGGHLWGETLSARASTDELTGLPNRRTFNDCLRREVERSRRHRRAMSVALMDLDHFKAINDRFGHPVGDRVLVEVAQRIRAASREGELVGRIGGEEFGWIMPEADGQAGVAAAERLRRLVVDEPFEGVGPLSVSIGVCSLGDVDDQADLLARADEALYLAKASGRDQVSRYVPAS